MIDETLELIQRSEPDSLRPRSAPGFPVRRLDPSPDASLVLEGRRARASGNGRDGITEVTVAGESLAVTGAPDGSPAWSEPPDVVEVGIDRLYRRWEDGDEALEELWLVPINLPYAIRRWRRGSQGGARIVWQPPSDPGSVRRMRSVAASWMALDRSWARDVGEAAYFQGPAELSKQWAWATARLLASSPLATPASPSEVAWTALGLCCIGRADLAGDVAHAISDLGIRAHTEGWINQWAGKSGTHPAEGADPFPPSIGVVGRTDVPLGAATTLHNNDPVSAGAFCGRLVSEGLGIRPDSEFGRVRFGPSERHFPPLDDLAATRAVALKGLAVAHGARPMSLTFGWTRRSRDGLVTHTLEVLPDSGGTPLQAVFEPELLLREVQSVAINGEPAEADIRSVTAGLVSVRLQSPLDQPRHLRIVGVP